MNLRYKYRFFLLIALAALLTAGVSVFSQPLPAKIDINPLNRAFIYFKGNIPGFTSQLSPDKKHVSIRMYYNGASSPAISKSSNGIIKQVDVKRNGDSILINVFFTEPRGYNAYLLPYSDIIVIEAFRWNELTKAEDLYRQGLLAYESGVLSEAMSFFEKAAAMNHPNANFFAGLLSILEEEFIDAESYLLKAENLGSNIPDLYAALSYIFDMRNDGKKAESYKRKFRALTGVSQIKEIPSNYFSQETEQTDDEPASLLDIIEKSDSLITDTSKADTTTKTITEIKFANDTTPVLIGGEKKQDSFLPEWMNSFAFYAVGIGLAFVLILISSYMKWRNSKLRYLKLKDKSVKENAFRDNLKKAEKDVSKVQGQDLAKYQPKNKAIQSQAANAYNKAEGQHVQTDNSEPTKTAAGSLKSTAEQKASKEKKRESLEQQLEKLADKLSTEPAETKHSAKSTTTDRIAGEAPEVTAPPINPSFQLALHLHEEQEKLRNRNIEEIDIKLIPEDRDKLSDFAKKLGIDKGSVSVKKQLSSLESDKELINSLYKKFAAGKKDKPD